MSLNLINTVQSRFTDSTTATIGGQLGLDPATAKAGSAALVPIILAAMTRIANQQSGVDSLLEIIRVGQYDGSLIDRLPAMLSSGSADTLPAQGSRLIDKLVGSDADPIITSVSQCLGFKVAAVRSLWAMIAPLVVDVIAGEIVAQNWRPREFRNRLISSRNELAKAMPPEVAVQLGLRKPLAKRAADDASSSDKSGGIDFSYVIAFIVSAITVFFLTQYFLKPARIDERGQPAPQVLGDSDAAPVVPEIVPSDDAGPAFVAP